MELYHVLRLNRSPRLARQAQRIAELPAADRRLLVLTGISLVIVRLALKIFPYRGLVNRICALSVSSGRRPALSAPTPEQLAWAVSTMTRFIPGIQCLTQALVLRMLLTREGYPASLRVGIARDEFGDIQGHAWVEIDGHVLIGGSEAPSRYQPLTSLDAPLSQSCHRFGSTNSTGEMNI